MPTPLAQDYHVHSTLSPDGGSTMDALCLRAIELGIAEIGFSEHASFDPRDPMAGFFDPNRYFDEIATVRERYGHQIAVRAGLEVNYSPGHEEEIRSLLEVHPFDFVLGGVHLVEDSNGWANLASEGDSSGWFQARDERAGYLPYFDLLRRAVGSGLFDLIAHFDLCKWYGVGFYGPFRPDLFASEVDTILKDMIGRGIGLEINASGLFEPPAEPYPTLDIVQRYVALGGVIVVVGSDAHHTTQVGQGVEHVVHVARAAGVPHLTSFIRRRPQPRPFIAFRPLPPRQEPEPLPWR